MRLLWLVLVILFVPQNVSLPGPGPVNVSASASIRYYSNSSFWNTPIPSGATLDPNSASIVSTAITPYASNTNLTNSASGFGIGAIKAASTDPTYTVVCNLYGCGNTVTCKIPMGAKYPSGSDHALRVIQPSSILANTLECDMWQANYNSATNTWSAGSRWINQLYGWGAGCVAPAHCNGPVAAGFAGMGGVIRPEEIAAGHIDHALMSAFVLTKSGCFVGPATHTDGSSSNAFSAPEGMRFRLDPTFNVSAQTWPTWEKIIAVAMQTYGVYVGDTGGTIAIYGQTDNNAGNTTWASVGVPNTAPKLTDIPWNRMQVLTIGSCN